MTKEELSKYYYLSLEIKQIEAKISEINDTYMSASKINGMPKSHKISNPQEERMLLVEKYQEKLERKSQSYSRNAKDRNIFVRYRRYRNKNDI